MGPPMRAGRRKAHRVQTLGVRVFRVVLRPEHEERVTKLFRQMARLRKTLLPLPRRQRRARRAVEHPVCHPDVELQGRETVLHEHPVRAGKPERISIPRALSPEKHASRMQSVRIRRSQSVQVSGNAKS